MKVKIISKVFLTPLMEILAMNIPYLMELIGPGTIRFGQKARKILFMKEDQFIYGAV